MPRQKQHPRMPRWIWRLSPKILPVKQKHFLAYIWWCGPAGCHSWNYRLARIHKMSSRTVRRWISQLKKLHLIHIGHASDKGRTIWANPYYTHQVWLEKRQAVNFSPGWPNMATINNAQQRIELKSALSSSGSHKEPPATAGDGYFTASNAGGLIGSETDLAGRPVDDPAAEDLRLEAEKNRYEYMAQFGKIPD